MITKAVIKDTSTVPIYFCHSTAKEVSTPKVKKPCLMVNQTVVGKKAAFFPLIPKYATKVKINAKVIANTTAVPNTVSSEFVIASTDTGIETLSFRKKY